MSTRKSIRNSESPKLYSNNPARASRPLRQEQRQADTLRRPAEAARQIDDQDNDEPEPDAESRQAALSRDLDGHVVEMRIDRDWSLCRYSRSAVESFGTDARQGMVFNHPGANSNIAMRSRMVGSFNRTSRKRVRLICDGRTR